MAYRRGDVIAVPYDYSDLTGGKVRPAVIVSSDAYNYARPDVVAAGISTQIGKATLYDHILADWKRAGLRYPSLVRGRLLTLEQTLIRHTVGRLSASDLAKVEAKLATLLLSNAAVADYLLMHIDLTGMPGRIVPALTEKSVRASLALASQADSEIDVARIRNLLLPKTK